MNSCLPSWLHIKLPLLHSVVVGEGLAASLSVCKCGPSYKGHLHRLKIACASFYTEKSHDTARADCVATPGNLKSP